MRNEDRTTAAGDRTRERILETALPLYAQRGFAGTSVRRVANAADVNVATLAYHFNDKAGLYAAVIERLYAELSHFPLAPEPGDGTLIETAIRNGWSFVRDRPDMIRLLHRHLLDQGRHHDLASAEWEQPVLDRLRGVVHAVRPDWTETEFRLLVYTVLHLLVRFALEDPDQLAETIHVAPDQVDETIVSWIRDVIMARVGLPASQG